MFKLLHHCAHSIFYQVMLKIFQARLYQYMNRELPEFKLDLEDRETIDQIGNIWWIIEKPRGVLKIICFCFIDYTKPFDCVVHNKLWKILNERGILDHLTCLLQNLHAGQKATVRTRHGTMGWFKIGKGERKSCILSPCLFNLCSDCIK